MASIIVPTVGAVLLTTWMLQSTTAPEAQTLKLFSNNITPSHADTASTYTEASFTGYSAISLSRSSWATPTVSGSAADTSYATQTFTNSGSTSTTVYGAYIVGATSGTLLFAWRFDTPQTLLGGASLQITPTFSLQSAN